MNMTKKKFMISIFVLAVAAASYAEVSFGASLIGGSGIGSVRTDSFAETYGTADSTLNAVGGFSITSHISFGTSNVRFMIQPEVVMIFNNGVGNGFSFTYDDYALGVTGRSNGSISVTTIDLPLLLGSDFVEKNWILTAYVGPYITIPVVGSYYVDGVKCNLTYSSLTWGLTAGFGASAKLGLGSIMFDGRYYFDFAPVTMLNDSIGGSQRIFARRNIAVSVGYKFSI